MANTDSVAEWENAQKIVQTAIDNFGRIDMVVNNAGILRDRCSTTCRPRMGCGDQGAPLRRILCKPRGGAAFPQAGERLLVHITSTSGLIGSVGQTNYGAAKLGIAGLSRCIAMDMQRYKIRSNCIGRTRSAG